MPPSTFRLSGGTGSSFGSLLEGRLFKYKVIPFGLALAPRTFTKCMDAALAPLRLQGICVLNGPLQGVSELSQGYCLVRALDLRTNTKKRCSLPFSTNCVFGSSLGFCSDAGPSGSCPDFQPQCMFGPLQARPSCFREHLSQALMAAASPVLPLGLFHMRPFLWWMKLLEFRSTWPATRLIRVLHCCFRTLLIWRNPLFLQSGVRMRAIHRHQMVTTDASLTGWGSVFKGSLSCGVWTGESFSWQINCLKLRGIFLALIHFLPSLRGWF